MYFDFGNDISLPFINLNKTNPSTITTPYAEYTNKDVFNSIVFEYLQATPYLCLLVSSCTNPSPNHIINVVIKTAKVFNFVTNSNAINRIK
uniref:Uncharacterized protein n=1 Tax=viral metagenome TaxID=1070528 RepID=A0A6C0E397_9ZZZZ